MMMSTKSAPQSVARTTTKCCLFTGNMTQIHPTAVWGKRRIMVFIIFQYNVQLLGSTYNDKELFAYHYSYQVCRGICKLQPPYIFIITSRCTCACRNIKVHVNSVTLRGDKVSMLTHTYSCKPLRKIKAIIFNHQADSHLMYGLTSDLVICKFRKAWSYMTPNVLRPGVIKQPKPKPKHVNSVRWHIQMSFVTEQLHPWYYNTFFYSLGENSAHLLQLQPITTIQHFLITSRTHSSLMAGQR